QRDDVARRRTRQSRHETVAIPTPELGVGRIHEWLDEPERRHRGSVTQIVDAGGASPQQHGVGRRSSRSQVVDELGKHTTSMRERAEFNAFVVAEVASNSTPRETVEM